MIIKKIEIQNFRIFYGECTFELSNGLNLIVGSNGDGKTTLFESLEWLFRTDGTNKMDIKYISKKRYTELLPGESDDVRVAMTYEYNGKIKTLEKMFRFTKAFDGEVSTSNYSFSLVEENGVERITFDGVRFDRDISSEMRKFIMYKGGVDFDVLQSSNAMKLLVDNFGDIKEFDAYFGFMEYATRNADKARDNALRFERKNQDKIKELLATIDREKALLSDIEHEMLIKENEVANLEELLKEIERSNDASKLLVSVNSRIENLKKMRAETSARIRENYSWNLLEDMWVLVGFKGISDEYSTKVDGLMKRRNMLVRQHLIDIGAKKVKAALEDGVDYVKITDVPAKPFYKHDYIGDIYKDFIWLNDNLSDFTTMRQKIQKLIAFNNRLHENVKKIDANLEHEYEQKKRILVQTDGLTEEQLLENYDRISSWMDKKNRAANRVDVLKRQRDQHKETLEKAHLYLDTISEDTVAAMYAKTALILRHISDSFKNAKELNKKKLLVAIEDEANLFMERLNTKGFCGTVRIVEKANGQGEAFLMDVDSSRVLNPGSSLKQTYLLSLLLAIGKLYQEKGNTELPLIAEGSFSQFEEFGRNSFFDYSNRQMIVITGDYLDMDDNGDRVLNRNKIDAIDSTVYRLEKRRPFDARKLSTMQSIVTRIK